MVFKWQAAQKLYYRERLGMVPIEIFLMMVLKGLISDNFTLKDKMVFVILLASNGITQIV